MFDLRSTQTPVPSVTIPIEKMTADQCLAVIAQADTMKSYYDSRKARALARFADLRRPTRWGTELADGAPEEVALELGVSPRTAASQILQARNMVSRLPATMAALSAGQIDYKRAQSLNDLTAELSKEDARAVEKRVLCGGRRSNPAKFRDAVRYQAIKADPEGAERRRTEARNYRNVTFMPASEGMGKFVARLTAEETLAAHKRIAMLAQQTKTPDRTIGQCRADALMDLIRGKDVDHLQQAQVSVTVAMTTLMGLNRLPGELSGHGPITAEHARELAQNATWRRIITDRIGQVLEVGHHEYPSPDRAGCVHATDRECQLSQCFTPAEDAPRSQQPIPPVEPAVAAPDPIDIDSIAEHHIPTQQRNDDRVSGQQVTAERVPSSPPKAPPDNRLHRVLRVIAARGR
jgi:hypothetical protein